MSAEDLYHALDYLFQAKHSHLFLISSKLFRPINFLKSSSVY